MSYTDDEVKRSVDFFANGNTTNGSIINPLVWAASKYLEGKKVIEWYAPAEKYVCGFKSGNGYMTHNGPMIAEDHGTKAREYLKALNEK